MKKILVPFAAAFALAGCAADTASTAGGGSKEDTVYRTGSNIPSKSTRDPSSSTVSREDYERDRDRAAPPVNPNSGGSRGR